MANEIQTVEIGTPGPPGAGITTAEKNALAPKASPALTGSPTVTGTLTVTGDSATVFLVETAAGSNRVEVDTSVNDFNLVNAMDFRMQSDSGATEKVSIDGATGNIVTAGNISGVDVTATDDVNVGDDIIGTNAMKILFSIDADTSLRICAGAGSPEGVVPAGKGSLYLRWDGGVGTSQYTKTSNDGGNTGWTATG